MADRKNFPDLISWLIHIYAIEGELAAKEAISTLSEEEKLMAVQQIERLLESHILKRLLLQEERKPWERPWHNGILN